MRPDVVCLVPVRNAEADLPGLLSSAEGFCDAIVALDDGSTDATAGLLETHPLVERLLRNPPRPTSAGWNDSENRNRLLAAAAELAPRWIVSVDADERIDGDDATALRRFLHEDALPGLAYGLEHVRMWGAERCDPQVTWVYRVFAFEEGQRFPERRLHFEPIPESVPRRAYVRTSIRLRHLAATDEQRMRARAAKYAEADPAREFRTDFGGLDTAPETVVPWRRRDPEAPIVLGRGETDSLHPDRDDGDRPLLVCLLAARNAERDLPGHLDSVRRFADAVVALDDGSTDGTRKLLEDEPVVEVLLTRPERPSYERWDDALNRRMLLQAAEPLRPRWILSLDADERIDAADADALREFLEADADPSCAYGFRVYRMIDAAAEEDSARFDRSDLVVGRLFAFQPGQEFPLERLHFVPIPTSIPRDRWRLTTVRIQHLASATEERRRERFAKYLEADPGRQFQESYEHLLEPPGALSEWEPRPPGLPVLDDGRPKAGTEEADERGDEDLSLEDLEVMGAEAFADLDAPVLSAIVIARDDEDRIERSVRAVVEQRTEQPFEVIVVTSGSDRTAEIVRERFPDVTLVELPHPALPGEARNAGLAIARGDYVSFPGSHVELPQGSLHARIRAHELGYPLVTGTTINGNTTRAGWASYFLDHSTTLPGRPSGELQTPPPHCSYDREFLEQIGGFPEDMRTGEDTIVNLRLVSRGYRPYRAQDATLVHRSPCSDATTLVRHHFQRGLALGRIMLEGLHPGGRILDASTIRRTIVGYLPVRLSATSRNVRAWGGDLRSEYRRAYPHVVLGAAAAWAGTLRELFRPGQGKLRLLFGEPGYTVALVGLDRREDFPVGRSDVLLLARVSVLRPQVRIVALPRDLYVDIPGHGQNLLNAAYFVGATRNGSEDPEAGMRSVARTLRGNLGIRTTGAVLVDFDSFRRTIDLLGGISVDVPHAIDDEFVDENGDDVSAHFRPGRQRLDGQAALTYVRTRKSDGDVWRRTRHADVTIAITEALRRPRTLFRLPGLVRTARRSVRTTLPPLALAAVALTAARIRRRNTTTTVLRSPVVTSEQLDDGRWVHRGDSRTIAMSVRDGLHGRKGRAADERPDAVT